ncbi:hypothetical protein BJY00DRAFT_153855 [Aspergillus carlsbadensis]|nr:hypothetical protein BJY00DRAFT_153855 [Aspergillus carlsbadensis]
MTNSSRESFDPASEMFFMVLLAISFGPQGSRSLSSGGIRTAHPRRPHRTSERTGKATARRKVKRLPIVARCFTIDRDVLSAGVAQVGQARLAPSQCQNGDSPASRRRIRCPEAAVGHGMAWFGLVRGSVTGFSTVHLRIGPGDQDVGSQQDFRGVLCCACFYASLPVLSCDLLSFSIL